jgi:hypothetical protein
VARHHGSGRISAILLERFAASGNASLQLFDANGAPLGDAVPAAVRADGDFARLRARINPRLSPGTYQAELSMEDRVRHIAVTVDPIVMLRVDPPMLRMSGGLGKPLHANIVIANVGNVEADLPKFGALGIYEVNGIETAIGHAYRENGEDGLRTVARFVQELRNGYGGLLKLRLEGMQGPLPPGKACSLRVIATPSDRVRAGGVYTGVWPFANLNYAVRVEFAGKPPDATS